MQDSIFANALADAWPVVTFEPIIRSGDIIVRSVKSLAWAFVAFASFASSAAAEDSSSKLQLSRLHVIASPTNGIGVVKTANPGTILVEATLGFERTASVSNGREVRLAGLSFAVLPQDVFRAAASVDDALGILPKSKVFCARSLQLPKEVRSPANSKYPGARFNDITHVCLVDDGADGQFDRGFIDGANWPEDRRLFAIEPFSYSVRDFAPQKNARLIVSYQEGPMLALSSDIVQGQLMPASVRIGNQPANAPKIYSEIRFKAKSIPTTLAIGDAQVTILAFDRESKVLTYRIDHAFETRPAIVSVGEVIHTIYYTKTTSATVQ